jgi:hypothetical protein
MNARANIVGLLGWIPVERELPDDEETVLLYSPEASEPVWPGFRDGDVWRWADATEAHGVTHWAPMPAGPLEQHEKATGSAA